MMDSSDLAKNIVWLAQKGDIAAANRLLVAAKAKARRGELHARSYRLHLLFAACGLAAIALAAFLLGV
jgi:hypothetical protein